MYDHFAIPLAVMSVFILLDIITGVIGAAKSGRIDSTKMRDGLFHKSAFYLAFATAAALEVAASVMDLGITVPAVAAVAVYIVATEVVSILENICIINPELKNNDFLKLFGRNVDE